MEPAARRAVPGNHLRAVAQRLPTIRAGANRSRKETGFPESSPMLARSLLGSIGRRPGRTPHLERASWKRCFIGVGKRALYG